MRGKWHFGKTVGGYFENGQKLKMATIIFKIWGTHRGIVWSLCSVNQCTSCLVLGILYAKMMLFDKNVKMLVSGRFIYTLQNFNSDIIHA